jgi:hypothetical protein
MVRLSNWASSLRSNTSASVRVNLGRRKVERIIDRAA